MKLGDHSLAESEEAMRAKVGNLPIDFASARAVSTLYRAANAARTKLTNSVLREHDITWTGWVVLWVVWIWDGLETRRAAEAAGISKATLTGVVNTLVTRGWLDRARGTEDKRMVNLSLTPAGSELVQTIFEKFNAVEAQLVSQISPERLEEMTAGLRQIVETVEADRD
ncbi:MarR family winged helix-turn-helix transcriptional regulator [Ornithinimicrobium sp. INDO-MA30-4]|uniref:MarR family winged helix-turn-helix transcriptional regulator n=1 Tax=Ornithinimicrobium sp. INDO-MA30-4 TaxID=2908651 RepID=UPI001F224144|nr:MarR family transcriptional regulator [Ornithinimicrobium sp. INDO-MA30-4]UJH70838.1 MarR family transcriptional regulator [Ornithinimicrobium sp. INDO-MA30-4]